MPRVGQMYKHKQIKDEYYRIEAVDSGNKRVYLTSTTSRGQVQHVSFDQLKKNYERV